MSKIVLGNVKQFVGLLQANKALLQVPSFQIFSSLVDQVDNLKSGCTRCKMNKIVNNFKPQFDISLRQLDSSEAQQIKRIMNVDEIVYYVSNNGKMEKKTL